MISIRSIASTWLILGTALSLGACGAQQDKDPQVLLKRYILALEQDNPAAAYALLSEATRQRVSQAEFTTRWRAARIEREQQKKDLSELVSQPVEARAQITYPSGAEVKLTWINGEWTIEEGIVMAVQTPTPLDAVKAFVQAAEERNYRWLMKLLTQGTKKEVEQEINERLSAIRAAMNNEIEVSNRRALFTYGPGRHIELIKEGDQWRVKHVE